MLQILRYSAAVLHVLWLGCVITTSFYVAPSLFNNESGLTPNSHVAGEVIAPLLHKMHVTGWIAIPLMVLCLIGIAAGDKLESNRGVWIACGLLAAAWAGGLYSGTVLASEIHSIRKELADEFGGYHLAPMDDPRRLQFGKLHGISMMISMLDLALGLGSFYCVTQTTEERKPNSNGRG